MHDAELTTKRSKLLDKTIFDENLLTERIIKEMLLGRRKTSCVQNFTNLNNDLLRDCMWNTISKQPNIPII